MGITPSKNDNYIKQGYFTKTDGKFDERPLVIFLNYIYPVACTIKVLQS